MSFRDHAKRLLAERGVRVQRLSAEERSLLRGYDDRVPLSPEALAVLRPDNSRLLDLSLRYARSSAPVCTHTQWATELESDETDLRYFRGDNAYLWQYSRSPELNRLRYFIYAQYLSQRTAREGLWAALEEDGAFGCFTFSYEGMQPVSRDLLDSINELSFLDTHWGLFERTTVRVVDIGAGYGRLAHRMAVALPSLERYWCLDAVPRSTFLSEYYLAFRGVEQATVVPIDEMDGDAIPVGGVDLAINVHSFSEMSRAAIKGWLQWLTSRDVGSLLVVPNERDRILSREADGARVDCSDLIATAGYRLAVARPTIESASVRDLFGVHDCFLLFERD